MTDVDFLMLEAGCLLQPTQTAQVNMSAHRPTEPTLANMNIADIYKEHAAFVWRLLIRMGLSEADAEDVAQNVFIAVQKNLPQFRGECKFTTWLTKICFSCIRDYRKIAHRRREFSDEERVAQQADTMSDVAGTVERHQAQAILQSIMDGMSIKQREVFVLFNLEEMKADEIAHATGTGKATVYSRLLSATLHFNKAAGRINAKNQKLRWST